MSLFSQPHGDINDKKFAYIPYVELDRIRNKYIIMGQTVSIATPQAHYSPMEASSRSHPQLCKEDVRSRQGKEVR